MIPGSGRSPGGGNANSLQYSCLGNPKQRSLVGYSLWGHKESDRTEHACTKSREHDGQNQALKPNCLVGFVFVLILSLFIYLFWLCWVFIALHGLPLVAVGGSALRRGARASHCSSFSSQGTDSRHMGFSSCRTQAQQLWRMGLAAPRHVGSSWTRNRTGGTCFGRQILNLCTTREVPNCLVLDSSFTKEQLWTLQVT